MASQDEQTEQATGSGEKTARPRRDTKQLSGYLVDSDRRGFIALAREPDGSDLLEIAERDVVRRTVVSNDSAEPRRVIVHVDRAATVERRHPISIGREADLLQGSLLAAFQTAALRGPVSGGVGADHGFLVQLYVAKSETTLTCWEDCTLGISNCLTAN